LGYLFRDIEHLANQLNSATRGQRQVAQYHWGGGTPTYLTCDQMSRLFRFHQDHFNFAPNAEIAIEVDPRVTTTEQLACLRELGFNRVSMGVQDFDATVQQAIHRLQPEAMTAATIETSRALGFDSVNIDLIYGLPHQSKASFVRTLESVLRLQPDRIALYNFAYVPWLSPHQNQMDQAALPEPHEKLRIFKRALVTLLEAGYVYIGMDHFAKPADELSTAMHQDRLHRNFMGYTVMAPDMELLGFGVSAIGSLGTTYAQNQRKLIDYYRAIDRDEPPVFRGYTVSQADLLHRAIINAILCQGKLDYGHIGQQFGVDVESTFKPQLQQLLPMVDDGLVAWDCAGFHLTPIGRILSRNVAMVFDAYLGATAPAPPVNDGSLATKPDVPRHYSRTV
jgi:oxygen-independent coproporphyrinogen-3 oxidase